MRPVRLLFLSALIALAGACNALEVTQPATRTASIDLTPPPPPPPPDPYIGSGN